MTQHTTQESAQEIWLDIPGYEGRYQASSEGRIRSVNRTITCTSRWGTQTTRQHTGRVLRPQIDNKGNGYYSLALGDRNLVLVHAAVALTFIGPRPAGCEVHHIDGDKFNNRPMNLAYVQKMTHRTQHGKIAHIGIRNGSRNGNAKLTEDAVRDIRRRYAGGEYGTTLAREYAVSHPVIYCVIHRKTWKHID